MEYLIPILETPKQRQQELLSETEGEIEDMDDCELGPGDF
jgi:hypothetical protein